MLSGLGQSALETIEGVGEGALAGVGQAVNQSLPGLLGLDKGPQPDTGNNAEGQTLYQQQNPTVTGAPVPTQAAGASGAPAWVMPAAIGGGALVLLAVVMLARR